MSSFPSKKHIYCLFLIFCSRVSVKISKNWLKLPKLFIFLFFCIFPENRRNLNCFHCRYEFCMENYPKKTIFIELAGKAYLPPIFIEGYSLAIKLIFSKIWTFLILLYLSSFLSKKHIYCLFLIFCSRVSVKISKNWLKLPKLFNFLFFCIFPENRRNLNCFHRRYEFCMQKYPNKHIIIEFAGKT